MADDIKSATTTTTAANVMSDREHEGRCGKCGIQTHRLKLFGLSKESLTIAEFVLHGRCLLCNPLQASSSEETIQASSSEGKTSSLCDDTHLPVAIPVPFEFIEKSELIEGDVVMPEPSAPPMEEESSITGDVLDNEPSENDFDSGHLESLSSDPEWEWHIIDIDDVSDFKDSNDDNNPPPSSKFKSISMPTLKSIPMPTLTSIPMSTFKSIPHSIPLDGTSMKQFFINGSSSTSSLISTTFHHFKEMPFLPKNVIGTFTASIQEVVQMIQPDPHLEEGGGCLEMAKLNRVKQIS